MEAGRSGKTLSDDEVSNVSSALWSNDQSDPSGTQKSGRSFRLKKKVEPPPVEVDMETRNVYCAKIIMIGVLSMTAVAGSMITFLFTTDETQGNFQAKLLEHATELTDRSQVRLSNKLDSLETLAMGFTSFSSLANETWPEVTLPVFEAQGGGVREQLRADWLALVNYVDEGDREDWEKYSLENQEWISESRRLRGESDAGEEIFPSIFRRDPLTNEVIAYPEDYKESYAPTWQITPPSYAQDFVNYDQFDVDDVKLVSEELSAKGRGTLSAILDSAGGNAVLPHSYIASPVFEDNTEDSGLDTVSMLLARVPLHTHFEDILPQDVEGIVLVMRYLCEGKKDIEFSFEINGPNVGYLGPGNLHSRPRWTSEEIQADLPMFNTVPECTYSVLVYPSDAFSSTFDTNRPAVYTSIVVLIFFVTFLVFIWYDCNVNQRQDKVATTAAKTTAIVDSFFPSHIRDRIMNGDEIDPKGQSAAALAISRVFDNELLATKPIADLFPHATVMFADLVGFTAWSSVREPSQVFTLLETVYNSFDRIAHRRRVFKVETIGDCYVAAAGLPEPREDHAVVMARFSKDCLDRLKELVQKLEISLGPGTGDLAMRFGLHSGPVTGGVLRGDKSRFQLFGDTMNTAARIESSGMRNKIHLSKETAALLRQANKESWLKPRDDVVNVKGKGTMETFWLIVGAGTSMEENSDNTTSPDSELAIGSTDPSSITPRRSSQFEKSDRLVEWNVDVLARCLKNIIAMRGLNDTVDISAFSIKKTQGSVLSEVREVITLPNNPSKYKIKPEEVELGYDVMEELTDFVTEIANSYQNNHFHNFQHASHVTLSLSKLLTRVVAPEAIDYNEMSYRKRKTSTLHKFTFGITSDPLTHFACTFSALIHDVDHPGVPNAQLVRESAEIAREYNNQSCAEQHSVDLAWQLLMQPKYTNLRSCIYSSQAELERFRELVVNSVMATDIVDKELGKLRKRRWEAAFRVLPGDEEEDARVDANRKATIVIEHLIQAADVAHTMQHWHVYRKWNERFFQECYQAYLDGRAEHDPSSSWYEGELGFFDYYIIPLAKKLEDCGVFGVSSDECLNYAKANRLEWESKGREVVEEYLKLFKEE